MSSLARILNFCVEAQLLNFDVFSLIFDARKKISFKIVGASKNV